jgi:hypothetical protein
MSWDKQRRVGKGVRMTEEQEWDGGPQFIHNLRHTDGMWIYATRGVKVDDSGWVEYHVLRHFDLLPTQSTSGPSAVLRYKVRSTRGIDHDAGCSCPASFLDRRPEEVLINCLRAELRVSFPQSKVA